MSVKNWKMALQAAPSAVKVAQNHPCARTIPAPNAVGLDNACQDLVQRTAVTSCVYDPVLLQGLAGSVGLLTDSVTNV